MFTTAHVQQAKIDTLTARRKAAEQRVSRAEARIIELENERKVMAGKAA